MRYLATTPGLKNERQVCSIVMKAACGVRFAMVAAIRIGGTAKSGRDTGGADYTPWLRDRIGGMFAPLRFVPLNTALADR